MKQIAVGFENSAAKCLVFHRLDRREPKRIFECSASPIVSLFAAGGYGFKASSCIRDTNLRVWKTSLLGHESSFSFICRGGGYFTGQPVFNPSASRKDRLGQCLRLGWPTAGGRPLHPQAIKRRLVGQDFAQLSGAARFQSPFFHPGGYQRVDRKIWSCARRRNIHWHTQ